MKSVFSLWFDILCSLRDYFKLTMRTEPGSLSFGFHQHVDVKILSTGIFPPSLEKMISLLFCNLQARNYFFSMLINFLLMKHCARVFRGLVSQRKRKALKPLLFKSLFSLDDSLMETLTTK